MRKVKCPACKGRKSKDAKMCMGCYTDNKDSRKSMRQERENYDLLRHHGYLIKDKKVGGGFIR